jgi:tRNA-dihydrouridine synthase
MLEFRKFYKGYLKAAPGAAQLRGELMTLERLADVEERLAAFLVEVPSAAEAGAVPA